MGGLGENRTRASSLQMRYSTTELRALTFWCGVARLRNILAIIGNFANRQSIGLEPTGFRAAAEIAPAMPETPAAML